MNQDELLGNQWLFAYEVNVKGWLPFPGGIDYVLADPRFALLKQNGVHFYDDTIAFTHGPSKPMSLSIRLTRPPDRDDDSVNLHTVRTTEYY